MGISYNQTQYKDGASDVNVHNEFARIPIKNIKKYE